MAFSFECVAVTHIGNRRKNNEDNFFIGELLTPEEQGAMSQSGNKIFRKNLIVDGSSNRVFAVSDGMGGHEHGEVASYIAVSALNDFVVKHKGKASRWRKDKFAYIQEFQEVVGQANSKILDYAAENNATDNMGATLSGLIVFSDEVAPLNIGDSSTFLYENDALRKLTADDNEISIWRDNAKHTELEAHGKRLTKYFGLPKSSGILTAAISSPVPLRAEQIYLIASDGLTDFLSVDSISQIIGRNTGNLEKISDELVETVLSGDDSGRDNITVVMLKITKPSK
ncbi:phosphatase [Clostridia bacterium]|nr:phosphatase [Clostridia bacterium]